jgi:hypothetical protein
MLLSCASLLVQQAQAYHAMQPEDRHVLIGALPARKETMRKHSGRKSVAHNVESQAAKGVTIKYLTAFEGRPGDLRKSFIATRRKMTDGDEQDDESFWDQKDGKWELQYCQITRPHAQLLVEERIVQFARTQNTLIKARILAI